MATVNDGHTSTLGTNMEIHVGKIDPWVSIIRCMLTRGYRQPLLWLRGSQYLSSERWLEDGCLQLWWDICIPDLGRQALVTWCWPEVRTGNVNPARFIS